MSGNTRIRCSTSPLRPANVAGRQGVGRVCGGRGECRCRDLGLAVMRSASRLIVDARVHSGEITRFRSHVVCG